MYPDHYPDPASYHTQLHIVQGATQVNFFTPFPDIIIYFPTRICTKFMVGEILFARHEKY